MQASAIDQAVRMNTSGNNVMSNGSAINAAMSPTINGNSNIAASPASQRSAQIPLGGTPNIANAINANSAPMGNVPTMSSDGAIKAAIVGGDSIRKIIDKDGSTTYTNNSGQPGGVALGASNSRGTFSVVGSNNPTANGIPTLDARLNSLSAIPNNDPTSGQTGLGVRKVVGQDGSVTYTNNSSQSGGVQLDDKNSKGTLSVISDPRTEGMTPQQAVAYWQSQSDRLDAKAQQRDIQASLAANVVQPGDSIGTVHAKRMNTQSLMKQQGIQTESDIAGAKATQAASLENIRQGHLDERQQRNLDAQNARLTAQLDSRERIQAAKTEAEAGKVTPAQHANNAEIILARKRMTGMSMNDIKGKTQQFLPNGRENPNYDSTLSSTWHLANQRMVGNDSGFDAFSQRMEAAANSAGQPSIADRFNADKAMQGHVLGAETQNGHEVHDASGKLIGYYR